MLPRKYTPQAKAITALETPRNFLRFKLSWKAERTRVSHRPPLWELQLTGELTASCSLPPGATIFWSCLCPSLRARESAILLRFAIREMQQVVTYGAAGADADVENVVRGRSPRLLRWRLFGSEGREGGVA